MSVSHNLPIEYNRRAPLGVVSDDPVIFLLCDKLFDDFKIITNVQQNWLHDLPLDAQVTSLGMATPSGRGIERLFRSKKFVDLAKREPKRKYVLYSPLDPPYRVNPLTLLMNSPTIAHAYENKRYFRDEFADLIRMPDYEIKYMNELDRAAAYRSLRDQFGSFVLQDEESSGSKGTFLVRSEDEYLEAVRALKLYSRGPAIVVSKFVRGETSSVQVCITKYGIFSGGIQRQLVNSKYLCNPGLAGSTKWCGGELGSKYSEFAQHQAQEMASIVGSELASHGYKGVFGLDLIVTPGGEVYAIEINARLTGYSHLISNMQFQEGKIPFLLLHILELGNYKYEVTDLDALPSTAQAKKPLSYMLYNNPLPEDMVLEKYLKPGLYRFHDGQLTFVEPAYTIDALRDDESMLLLFCKYGEGDGIGRGKRIFKIIKYGKTMVRGDLNRSAQEVVLAVKDFLHVP